MEQLRNYMKNVGDYLFKNKGEIMTKNELVAKINAIAPLLVTLIGCINAFLTLRGLPCIQIGDEAITLCISGIATVIGEFWSWWRNNNWTTKAQVTQPVLNGLKQGSLTTEQVEQFVEENTTE